MAVLPLAPPSARDEEPRSMARTSDRRPAVNRRWAIRRAVMLVAATLSVLAGLVVVAPGASAVSGACVPAPGGSTDASVVCLAVDVELASVVVPGSDTTVTVIVRSTGTAAATGVAMTVSSAGGQVVPGSLGGAVAGKSQLSGNVIAVSGLDLAAGEALKLTFRLRVDLVDRLRVTAAVGPAGPTAAAPTVESISERATSAATTLDLGLTPPEIFDADSVVEYRLYIANDGLVDAEDVVVHASLPTGARLVEAPPECTGDGIDVACTIGTLRPDADRHLPLLVRLPGGPDGSSLGFRARAEASTPLTAVPTTHAFGLLAGSVGMTASRVVPTAVVAGAPFEVVATIENTGTRSLREVEVVQPVPDGVVLAAGTDSCTLSDGALRCVVDLVRGGQRVAVAATLRTLGSWVAPTMTLPSALARVDGGSVVEHAIPAASADVSVVAGPWLTLDGATPTVTIGGDAVALAVRYGNLGPSDVRGGAVVVTVPAGIEIAAPAGCAAAGNELRCELAESLVAGEERTVELGLSIAAGNLALDGVTVPVSARFESATPGPGAVPQATAEVAVTARAQLDVRVEAPGPFVLGAAGGLDVVVTNNGPSVAASTVVAVRVPAVLADAVVTMPAGACERSDQVSLCRIGSIDPGRSVRLSVRATVPREGTPGVAPVEVTAETVTPGPPGEGPADANRTSVTASVPVVARAALIAAVRATGSPLVAGTAVSFRATVTNAGPSFAEAVTVVVTPSDGLVLDVVPGCVRVGTGLRCDLGRVPASAELPVSGTLASSARSATVTVRVSTTTPEPDTGDNVSEIAVPVAVRAAVAVTALDATGLDGDGTVVAGERATIRFAVDNLAGPSDAIGVSVVIPLPEGVTASGAAGDAGLVCRTADRLLVCTGDLRRGDRSTIVTTVAPPAALPAGTAIRLSPAVVAAAPVELVGPVGASVELRSGARALLGVEPLTADPTVVAGDRFRATARIVAQGPSLARDVRVVAFVAAGAALTGRLEATLGGTPCVVQLTVAQIACPVGDVAPGAELALTIDGGIAEDALDGTSVIVQVLAESSTPAPLAPRLDAPVAEASVVVRALPELVVAVEPAAGPGNAVVVSLVNDGRSSAREVRLDVEVTGAPLASLQASGLRCDMVTADGARSGASCRLDRLGAGAQGRVQVALGASERAGTATVTARARSLEPAARADRATGLAVVGVAAAARASGPVPALASARAGASVTANFTIAMPAATESPGRPTPPLVVRQTVQPGLRVERADITGLDSKPSCAVDDDGAGYACVIDRIEPGRHAKLSVQAVVVAALPEAAAGHFAQSSSVYFADGTRSAEVLPDRAELSPRAELIRQAMELLPDGIRATTATAVRVAPFPLPTGLPLIAGMLLTLAFLGYLGGRTVRGRRARGRSTAF
jgi:hypothetical protein